jgi:hypothetical protein
MSHIDGIDPYVDAVVEYHQIKGWMGLTAAEAKQDPVTRGAFFRAVDAVVEHPEIAEVYDRALYAAADDEAQQLKAVMQVREIEGSIVKGLFDNDVIGDESFTRQMSLLRKNTEVEARARTFNRLFAKVLPPRESVLQRVAKGIKGVVGTVADRLTAVLPEPSVEPETAPTLEQQAALRRYEMSMLKNTAMPSMPADAPSEAPLSFLPEPEEEPFDPVVERDGERMLNLVPEPTTVPSAESEPAVEAPAADIDYPTLPFGEAEPEEVRPQEVLLGEQLPIPEGATDDEMLAIFAHNILVGIRSVERAEGGVRDAILHAQLERYLGIDEVEIDFMLEDLEDTGSLRSISAGKGRLWTTWPVDEAKEPREIAS